MTVGGERADEWTIQWTDGQNGVKWTRVPAPRPAAAGEGTAVMKHRRATGASLLPKTLPAVGSPPIKVVHVSITHWLVDVFTRLQTVALLAYLRRVLYVHTVRGFAHGQDV